MKLSVFVATSLDGYIATTDHGLSWLSPYSNSKKSDYGYFEFMNEIDAVIMGRNTFEVITQFKSWPYDSPVFVLSNTHVILPKHLEGKIENAGVDIVGLLRELEWEGYHNINVEGGMVITSMLNSDLIDEMIITRIPILLGSGIPLFGSLDNHMKWKHKKTEVYDNSLVKSTYIRER